MNVPRFNLLRVKLELQPQAHTTAIAMPDPSCICDLHHSSGQHQILNPLSEARDQTHNPIVTSQIHFRCATMGTLPNHHFLKIITLYTLSLCNIMCQLYLNNPGNNYYIFLCIRSAFSLYLTFFFA